jgi:hypothetical protein
MLKRSKFSMQALDHSSVLRQQSLAKNAALHLLGIMDYFPKNTLSERKFPLEWAGNMCKPNAILAHTIDLDAP